MPRLLAFSCRTRNFCPSCQAKRSALFAEHVVTELLEPVPHRHVVLTIPRVLRGLFQRERRLLGLLARAARDAIVPSVRAILDDFHPHVPALVTDGAFIKEGEFLNSLLGWDPGQHMVRFYGWYSNRSRGAHRRRPEPGCRTANRHTEGGDPRTRGHLAGRSRRLPADHGTD